jgi:hypothetical protein
MTSMDGRDAILVTLGDPRLFIMGPLHAPVDPEELPARRRCGPGWP